MRRSLLTPYDGGRPPRPCWGVVQPVGHHTVNVDGEGSNPSAPANLPSVRFKYRFQSQNPDVSQRHGINSKGDISWVAKQKFRCIVCSMLTGHTGAFAS